jgi:ribosome-associated toxin RatA of RatAB toxin-antitoxin module
MKILKILVIAFVVLIAAVALIGFMLPKEYKVTRSQTIAAPAEVVFEQVNDLKKNEAWSPWKDTTMQITYSENTVGVGAKSSWTSKDMGNGSQTITESTPSTALHTHLDFGEMGTAEVQWTFAAEGEGTKVTQEMTGEMGNNPFKKLMGLMMDKMIGPMFEQGLASLKSVSETRAAEVKAEQAATQQAAATPADEAVAAPAAPAAQGAATEGSSAGGRKSESR